MQSKYRVFILPVIVALVLLAGVFAYLGTAAFLTTLLLIILEVTLSFDNAVVNAKVLTRMTDAWQKRFLTWGILFAVVGTRIVLPILIVSLSVMASPILITKLALFSPAEYGHLLEGAHHAIAAFGGAFLLMVALKYFLDVEKDVHWIHVIEHHVSKLGNIESVEMALALALLVTFAILVPAEAATILIAGAIGLILFIAIEGVASAFDVEADDAKAAASSGIALFLYLNLLDAAFSLDGVVGAFAITDALPVIVIGLGVGAYFVRSLTVFLVRQKTLESLAFVEHGAHWAILGLALSMFASLLRPIPEIVTGLIGIVFIIGSVTSSLRARKRTPPALEA